MKTGAPSVEWALGTDLKQKQMVLGILWECWMVLLYFPPTSVVSFLVSSQVLQWQRGWLCVQQRRECPAVRCCCHIPWFVTNMVWTCTAEPVANSVLWDPKSERHLWEKEPEKEVCLQHMKTFEILLKIQALRQLVFWKQSILQLVVWKINAKTPSAKLQMYEYYLVYREYRLYRKLLIPHLPQNYLLRVSLTESSTTLVT